jgi:hypothetical protein
MKFTSIHISFPILKITSLISQAISRQPTLFEKTILELINRFGGEEVYREFTLEKVFSEILQVPETGNFVQPTLEQLVNFSIVDCKTDHTSLAEVRIKDLSLTPNGKRLLERGVMPVFKEKNRLEHFYDPIQDRLIAAQELPEVSEKAKGKPLEMDTEGLYPDYLIREEIQKQEGKGTSSSNDPPRGKGDFSPHDMIPAGATTLWKTLEGRVIISDEGELNLGFDDPFYDDYFSQFNSEWLFQHYLAELFVDDLIGNAASKSRPGAFHEISESIADIFPARDLDLKMKLSGEKTHFLRYHPFLKRQLQIKSHTLLVVFEYPAKENPDQMRWDAKKNGALVLLPDPFPLEHCHYLNSDEENFFVSPFEIKLNGELFSVPLGYSLKPGAPELKIQPIFKMLEKKIDESGEVQAQLIKLFWRSSEEVLRLIEKMTA